MSVFSPPGCFSTEKAVGFRRFYVNHVNLHSCVQSCGDFLSARISPLIFHSFSRLTLWKNLWRMWITPLNKWLQMITINIM